MSKSNSRRTSYHTTAIIAGIVVTAGLAIGLILLTDWPPLLIWLAAVNLTTFAMFGIDKASARIDGPRIPEVVLHAFTLLGGFLGQLLGRLLFRHKTNFNRHPSFTIVLIVAAILWAAIIYLLNFRS